MSIGSDYICVWLENGCVHVGIRRIYDYDHNTGYILRKFGTFDEIAEYQQEANSLAIEVSQLAGIPLVGHWEYK